MRAASKFKDLDMINELPSSSPSTQIVKLPNWANLSSAIASSARKSKKKEKISVTARFLLDKFPVVTGGLPPNPCFFRHPSCEDKSTHSHTSYTVNDRHEKQQQQDDHVCFCLQSRRSDERVHFEMLPTQVTFSTDRQVVCELKKRYIQIQMLVTTLCENSQAKDKKRVEVGEQTGGCHDKS